MPITPQQFIVKWKKADLSERAAYQQHFLDLCELLQHPKPADVDPAGLWFTFEKGVEKTDGGQGWADVWLQGKFSWEYKGKHKDLKAAYQQLLKYRESLENPPLLIVCDLDRFEIHTNFTGTVKTVYPFDLDGLADPKNIAFLRNVFYNPDALKPGQTQKALTEEVAAKFAKLADGMRARGIAADHAAHFLMKLMFCMFAEDIDLLPHDLFARTVANAKGDSARLTRLLISLFDSMARGEPYGADDILHFNGGLFADSETIELKPAEIDILLEAAEYDWSQVEPTIFGTLFERTLDPSKRAQIGAHYTSREDIETLLEPVVMDVLRREWVEVREKADKLWEKAKGSKAGSKPKRDFEMCIDAFLFRLAHATILDPACGSGNFLYVGINLLLSLEKEVITYAEAHDKPVLIPAVRPSQLSGLEINPYARELAQVSIWIGFLQWMRFNGFVQTSDPVLDTMDNIRNTDAILDLSDPASPTVPDWPEAEFIVGNPPFLGDKLLRSNLDDEYVDSLFSLYRESIPNKSDLCCYWFERARRQIEIGKSRRAGLLATQGIRGGANREVVKRIRESGGIFFAESDRPWVLDGANVHVSMIGFDNGNETKRVLDGKSVSEINANLTASTDVTQAQVLARNLEVSFQGPVKVGSFELDDATAREFLASPNPTGLPSSDVVRPWVNGITITQREEPMWIVDFRELSEKEAARYDRPFEHVTKYVKPEREKTKRERRRRYLVDSWRGKQCFAECDGGPR
jgi:type II restriction/modification system DNA methylase subunit YeeA